MSDPPPTLFDKAIRSLKNHRVASVVLILGVSVIAIGSLTDAITKIQTFFSSDTHASGDSAANGETPPPTGNLVYEVPENSTVTYDGPSPMGLKEGTYYIEGSLQIGLHSQTATTAQWKTILYSIALGKTTKWNYQGEDAIIVETAPYPNIRALVPSFSLVDGPDPLATLTTYKDGKWELHGLIGEHTGKNLHGGDTDATVLIAAGTFTGTFTNPTSFTVTRGYNGDDRLGPSFIHGLGTPPLSFTTSTLNQPVGRKPFDQ